MGSTDRTTEAIRPLSVVDLDGAQRLSEEAGWNQVAADWRVFLELGHLFGVDGPSGALCATGATLPLSGALGWISMIIVTRAARGRGIATRLVHRAIDDLSGRGLVPGLDATPAGREVYARLGFRDAWPIVRLVRPADPAPAFASPVPFQLHAVGSDDLATLCALDGRAFGTDRPGLLVHLLERAPGLAVKGDAERSGGFLLARPGRTATQLGPVVASDAALALAMIDRAIARVVGPSMIDLVDLHPALRSELAARGFTVQRGFTRMFHRSDERFGDAGCAVAVGGPELG